jgi:hypothetical protein
MDRSSGPTLVLTSVISTFRSCASRRTGNVNINNSSRCGLCLTPLISALSGLGLSSGRPWIPDCHTQRAASYQLLRVT